MTLESDAYDGFKDELHRELEKMDRQELHELYKWLESKQLEDLRQKLDDEGYVRLVMRRGEIGCAQFQMLVAMASLMDGVDKETINAACEHLRRFQKAALTTAKRWLDEGEFHIREGSE